MKNEDYPFYDICHVDTIKDLILTNEEEFTDDIAIKYIKRRRIVNVTYSELKKDIDSLGTYFYMRGIKNVRAAILGNNSYEWALCFLTLVCGNNIAVPIDKGLKAPEIIEVLKETECNVIFYDSIYIDVIKEMRDKVDELNTFINFKNINAYIIEGKKILGLGKRHFVFKRVKKEETAAIFYTCTISSEMRGIELSHENIISAALSSSQLTFLGDMTMATIPFHHMCSIVSGLIAPFVQRSIVIIDPEENRLMEDLRMLQPDSITAVPSTIMDMYKKLYCTIENIRHLKRKMKYIKFLLSHGIDRRQKLLKYIEEIFGGCLSHIICLGNSIDEYYVEFFRMFGIEVLNGYGLPETSSIISINRNEFNSPGSVGQVIPGCELRISEEGEVLVKGNMVMKGYYKDEELTRDVFKKGWLKTGDIGYMDSDGFLYIVGRMKNIILLSNGEMISPSKIEEYMLGISAVKQVSVYEKKDKIIAEVFPNYSFLNSKDITDVGSYIRNEMKSLNRNLSKSRKIDKVVIREKEFLKSSFSRKNNYKILSMKE